MRTRITSRIRREISEIGFVVTFWEDFDYNTLKKIPIRTKKGKKPVTYADAVIMADTETSRFMKDATTEEEQRNHICAWSLAIRTLSINICCLWGKKPSDLMKCLRLIRDSIDADEVFLYWHNMAYDWCFTRKFFFAAFGYPEHQLNTKPLYPVLIKFSNGLIMRDSLILSQRSLEKWAKDLDVDHQKAVGKWDYDAIRHCDTWDPDPDELLYIQNDVLAGVECIDKTMQVLKKTIRSIPLTSTGIPRHDCREIGRKNRAHRMAVKLLPEHYEEQFLFELAFHGGYTHENRWCKGQVYPNDIEFLSFLMDCYDYASSYPFQVLAKKFPDEEFWKLEDKVDAKYIKDNSEDWAFLIHIKAFGARLKDLRWPMPVLMDSKCGAKINNVCDNGRILQSDYFDMWVTDPDFLLIDEQYDFDKLIIDETWTAHKDYLPRWFTDYIYKLFENKTKLKGVDNVLYMIEKAKLNAASFGMCAQRPVKEDIEENYATGEFKPKEDFDYESEYQEHLNNYNTFLPYSWGVWITAYAQFDLFLMGKCIKPDSEGGLWAYSDTDSCYGMGWDKEKLDVLNASRRELLTSRGYGPVIWKGKEYFPGAAEFDGRCMQFKALHSKCYCKRPFIAEGDGFIMGGDLKITVAGVPKRGAKSLHNNINNFNIGTIFDGETSGKLQHTYHYVDEIYVDRYGNETGDSIDLSPCDYMITDPNEVDFEKLLEEEVTLFNYEDSEE